MLKWADRYPEIVIFPDNIRQLESPPPATSYSGPRRLPRRYVSAHRERLHRLSLAGEGNVVDAAEFVDERRGVWRSGK
jgi:hypothetical protein